MSAHSKNIKTFHIPWNILSNKKTKWIAHYSDERSISYQHLDDSSGRRSMDGAGTSYLRRYPDSALAFRLSKSASWLSCYRLVSSNEEKWRHFLEMVCTAHDYSPSVLALRAQSIGGIIFNTRFSNDWTLFGALALWLDENNTQELEETSLFHTFLLLLQVRSDVEPSELDDEVELVHNQKNQDELGVGARAEAAGHQPSRRVSGQDQELHKLEKSEVLLPPEQFLVFGSQTGN